MAVFTLARLILAFQCYQRPLHLSINRYNAEDREGGVASADTLIYITYYTSYIDDLWSRRWINLPSYLHA